MQHALYLSGQGPGRAPQVPVDAGQSARLARSGVTGRGHDDGDPASAGLAKAIDRLEEVIEQETAALRARAHVDLKDFNTRKSHGLLELTRAMRLVDGERPSEPLRLRLVDLRGKLDKNRAAIAVHLEAVREISTIIADAMQEAESDGTYTESAARVRPKS